MSLIREMSDEDESSLLSRIVQLVFPRSAKAFLNSRIFPQLQESVGDVCRKVVGFDLVRLAHDDLLITVSFGMLQRNTHHLHRVEDDLHSSLTPSGSISRASVPEDERRRTCML